MISRWFAIIWIASMILLGIGIDVWLVWTNASYGRVRGIDALFAIFVTVVYLLVQWLIEWSGIDKKIELNRNWKRTQALNKTE